LKAAVAHNSGSSRRKVSGVIVPHSPKWFQRLAAWLIFAAVRVVNLTLRYRWQDGSGYYEGGTPSAAIYCVWHNRLALCLPIYYGYVKHRYAVPTSGMAALVSASKDGAFLAAVLECFGVQPVRGSTSRRGPQALLELTSWAQRGYDLAITPDGPRGPAYQVQEGVMSLAQITGLPIIPSSYHLNWKLQAKSWDRFQIPLPFARCDVRVGPPIRVPRECTGEARELLRQQLEHTLRELSVD
jgi:lysophospholipid acyltransferase (LPLAT)-like uncharacterized protein